MARSLERTMVPSSATTTITETTEESSSSLEIPSQLPQSLVLRLSCRPPPKKKVSWKEGTVDNEFLQRKSSKKCCIFHKEKSFDEDFSDEEQDDRCRSEKNVDGGERNTNCCSHNGSGPSGCHSDD